MSFFPLTAVHTRYNLIETARVPIAIIGSLVFPTLAFCLFVLPQRMVTENPEFATAAVASMVVFAFMSAGLFAIGLDLAEQRAKPWAPYLRTLPGSSAARLAGLLAATLVIASLAMIPLLIVGGLFTAARPALPDLLAAIGLVILIAVTQVAMFLLAFGGGLFLPPQLFPQWLDIASMTLPIRQAREIVVGAALGTGVPLWAAAAIAGWTLVLGALAIWLYRRDEGRRYR